MRPGGSVGAPRTILVAEDSRIIQQTIVAILGKLDGVSLRLASDGLEALALARENKPDLLLTDHEMPGMNGIQLIRVLRGTWSRFELPALVLTANSETETKVMAFSSGASDYVTKPVEASELCARVLGQLELSQAVTDNLTARVQLLEARKYQAVGRLAAGVAHELNNPAQYATTNLSFLLKSTTTMRELLEQTLTWAQSSPDEPFARRIAQRARDEKLEMMLDEVPLAAQDALEGIQRMSAIISELREFAGTPDSEPCPVDLNRAIQNTVAVSQSDWHSSVEVQLDLQPRLPSVRGVPHALKQAFLSLLVNAVEAIAREPRPERGVVMIRSERSESGVRVTVSDDGPGVPQEHESRLFDPFFSTKPTGQGTGQGLFVAHSIIVGQCGGRLKYQPGEGRGATFVAWLPCAKDSESPVSGVAGGVE